MASVVLWEIFDWRNIYIDIKAIHAYIQIINAFLAAIRKTNFYY